MKEGVFIILFRDICIVFLSLWKCFELFLSVILCQFHTMFLPNISIRQQETHQVNQIERRNKEEEKKLEALITLKVNIISRQFYPMAETIPIPFSPSYVLPHHQMFCILTLNKSYLLIFFFFSFLISILLAWQIFPSRLLPGKTSSKSVYLWLILKWSLYCHSPRSDFA